MHLKRLHECWCTLSSADALCEYICTNSCAQNRRILKKNGYRFFVWVPLVEIGFSDLYSVWKVILSNGFTCVGIHILVLLVFCTCTLHCLKSRAFLVVISRDLSVHHSVHCFVWIPSLKSWFRVYSWEKAWTFLKSNDLDHIQSGTYRISETKSVYRRQKRVQARHLNLTRVLYRILSRKVVHLKQDLLLIPTWYSPNLAVFFLS